MQPTRTRRVLVVEDSAVIRRLIEVVLRPLDIQIEMAPNGYEGLEAAAERRPDLVLLDIGLPGIDGWDVLAGLQGATMTENVPVVMLTGHAEHYSELDAFARGARSFVTKPFQPAVLREEIKSLLEPV